MSTQKILVIDFDAASIEQATTSLTRAGFEVEVARDGVSGLEAFERLKPDLVLVEAMLPRKHGFEVCQEIKSTAYGKCTPILVTSNESKDTKYVAEALRLYGCDDYVQKPVVEGVLIDLCRKLLPDVAPEPKKPARPTANMRLDDLTEDELMDRLDGLIDAVTVDDESPLERDDAKRAGAEAPIAESDLVSFCERVFSSPDGGSSEPPSPPALTEEEVMGQLDALIPDRKRAGRKGRPEAPLAAPAPATSGAATGSRQGVAPVVAAPSPPVAGTSSAAEPGRVVAPSAVAPSPPAGKSSSTSDPVRVAAPGAVAPSPPVGESTAASGPAPARTSRAVAPSSPVAPSVVRSAQTATIPSVGPVEDTTTLIDSRDGRSGEALGLESDPLDTVDRPASKLFWVTGTAAALLVAVGLFGFALWQRGVSSGAAPVSAPPEPIAQPRLRSEPRPFMTDGRGGVPGETTPLRSLMDTGSPPAQPGSSEVASTGTVVTESPSQPPIQLTDPSASRPVAQPTTRPAIQPPVEPAPAAGTSAGATAPATAPPRLEPSATSEAAGGSEPRVRIVEPVAAPQIATPKPRPTGEATRLSVQDTPVPPPLVPEPVSRTRRGDLVALAEADSEPVPLRQPAPEYDPLARRMRQEGTVLLELLIDENGRVVDVRSQAGTSSNSRLVSAAQRAVMQWVYAPATKDGVDVRVWKPVSIEFRL